jgi:hypothetical protein
MEERKIIVVTNYKRYSPELQTLGNVLASLQTKGNRDKGTQPAHYNAGQEEKLKQHHNYGN